MIVCVSPNTRFLQLESGWAESRLNLDLKDPSLRLLALKCDQVQGSGPGDSEAQ